jgi:hypothetical protein
MSSGGELGNGLKSGQLQGVKTGMSFAKMESGIRKGVLSNIGRHDKTQDPTVGLLGSKKPIIFWLADYTNATVASTNVTTIVNLMSGGTNLSNSGAGSVTYVYPGVLNNRAYLDLNNGNDRILTGTTYMSGKNEMTVMMVARMAYGASGRILFAFQNQTISDTIGDVLITAESGQKVKVSFIGNPTTTSSVYQTFDNTIEGTQNNHWVLITAKFRLYQPGGQGSEVELYINGKLNMDPVTTTFTGSTSNFSAQSMNFGNNATQASGGSQLAAGLVLDYWANSSEQIRLENFFRWYYGFRF